MGISFFFTASHYIYGKRFFASEKAKKQGKNGILTCKMFFLWQFRRFSPWGNAGAEVQETKLFPNERSLP